MLSKKILSFSLSVGLVFGLALNVSAHMDQFSEMLQIPGCVLSINNSLKMIPDNVKKSEDVQTFCKEFATYSFEITDKTHSLSSEEKAARVSSLTEAFVSLCNEDARFKQAFDDAINGKTHASVCFCGNSSLSGRRNHRWTNSFH